MAMCIRSCFCSFENFLRMSPSSWMPIRKRTLSRSGFLPKRCSIRSSSFHHRLCKSSLKFMAQRYLATTIQSYPDKKKGRCKTFSKPHTMQWTEGAYTITTDSQKIDVAAVHNFLKTSYWAENIPYDVVQKSIAGSLCFGVFYNQQQVGFACVITDSATFAYLADVFILED